ncbi:MAG: hypothetical protein PHQ05_10260 [Sterolibacterium sp.]|nr:hypothetical protein [Sterolibacterium sp.]
MNSVMQAAPIRPLIAKGRNAGQFRPLNDIILDRLSAVKSAVVILRRDGFSVIDVDHMKGLLPRIWIESSARCAKFADAFTVKWATDADGPYQVNETRIGEVRVCWTVRGH